MTPLPDTALPTASAYSAEASEAERHTAQALLLACARTHLSDAQQARARQLAAQGVDWPHLLSQAKRHGVEPLLKDSLSAALGPEAVPEAVREHLDARARMTALRNLTRTRELLEVLQVLEQDGIEPLPLKGPTLGVVAYGDLALRRFIDLDILVPKAQARRAYHLLAAKGYRPYYDRTEAERQAHFDSEKSLEMVRGETLIELHWDFVHSMHGFYLDPERARQRAQTITLGGQPVRTLAHEDLVLYLCAHGSKHFWERLSWICDVAETLRTYEDALDWPALIRRARALHAGRMLLLGLQLAADLLGAALPLSVEAAARQNAAVQALAQRAADELFEERPEERPILRDAWFHLKMRERLRDRLPYYRHLARLSVRPTAKDRDWVALHASAEFGYYLVRPVRLVTNGLRRLLGS